MVTVVHRRRVVVPAAVVTTLVAVGRLVLVEHRLLVVRLDRVRLLVRTVVLVGDPVVDVELVLPTAVVVTALLFLLLGTRTLEVTLAAALVLRSRPEDVAAGDVVTAARAVTLVLVDDAVVHPATAAAEDVAPGDVVTAAPAVTLVLVDDPVVHRARCAPKTSPPEMLSPPPP